MGTSSSLGSAACLAQCWGHSEVLKVLVNRWQTAGGGSGADCNGGSSNQACRRKPWLGPERLAWKEQCQVQCSHLPTDGLSVKTKNILCARPLHTQPCVVLTAVCRRTCFPLCRRACRGQGQGPAKYSWCWRPGLPAPRLFLSDATAVQLEWAQAPRSGVPAEAGLEGGMHSLRQEEADGNPLLESLPRARRGVSARGLKMQPKNWAQSQRWVQISECPQLAKWLEVQCNIVSSFVKVDSSNDLLPLQEWIKLMYGNTKWALRRHRA